MIKFHAIHLDRVGTTSARFNNQTYELGDAATSRALQTILSIRNGGGKTSLLALVMSLLLPAAHQFVWTKTENRLLGDYVLDRDTSLVAVRLITPSGVVVVGAYYEWNNRSRPVDYRDRASELNRHWFVFCPQPSVLDLETLPRIDDAGDLMTTRESNTALERLGQANPQLRLTLAKTQTDFAQALSAHGVDTSLLAKQLSVVGQEGNFERMFIAGTEQGFADRLVEMLFDEEAAASLASRIAQNAALMAKAPEIRQEQEFVTEAADLLEQATIASAGMQAAQTVVADARSAAGQLRGALETAVTEHTGAALAATEQGKAADASAEAGQARRTVARNAASAYARMEATLQVEACTARVAALAAQVEDYRLSAAAWDLTDQVIATATAHAEVERLTVTLYDLERGADAQRAALDRAASMYRAALDVQVTGARDEISGAARREADARAALAETDAIRARLTTQLQESAVALADLERTLREIDAALAAARARGDVADHEDPAGALAVRTAQLVNVREELGHLRAEVASSEHLLGELDEQMGALRDERADRERDLELAEAASTRADVLHRDLCTNDTVVEIVGSDAVDIWAARGIVRENLHVRRSDLEAEIGSLSHERQRLGRALEAMNSSGLLPPSDDVLDVLVVLDRAGVPATAGYNYLASSIDQGQWARVLESHPELCAGVVVDSEDLSRAGLALAGLAPTGVVVVGTKEAVEELADVEHVVVGPLAAAYDSNAAPVLREAFEQRLEDAGHQHQHVSAVLAGLRELSARLDSFYEELPTSNALDVVHAKRDEASVRLADAVARSVTTSAQRAATVAALGETRRRVGDLTTRVFGAERVVERLESLSVRCATRPGLEAAQRAARGDHDRLASEEVRLAAERAGLEAERARAVDDQARARRDLDFHTGERHAVGDGPIASSVGAVDLADLRRAWVNTKDELTRAITDTQLEGQLTSARARYASECTRLDHEEAAVVDLARRLVRESPTSTDRLARAACQSDARVLFEGATLDHHDAKGTLVVWETHLGNRSSNLGAGSDVEALTDPDEAARRSQALLDEEHSAREGAELDAKRRDELAAIASDHTLSAERLGSEIDSLDALAVVAPPMCGPGFAGTPGEAHAATSSAIRRLLQSQESMAATAEVHRDLCQCLRELPGNPRYKGLSHAITATHATLTNSVLANPDEAARLAAQWRTRAVELDAELARAARHREICVNDLTREVTHLLDRLARADTALKMPAGLGAWEGQPFLRVRFEHPRGDPEAFRTHVGDAIDRAVAKRAAISGHELMKSAIAAAVPKGFHSTVLKPTPDFRTDRERVTTLSTWSGGERLTAAVVLFCVIAHIRCDRSGAKDFDPGALIIDNPLGQASLEAFVSLQLQIAELLGVQLIYTSAIKDPTVLGLFENVIRLANSEGSDGHGYVHELGDPVLPAYKRQVRSVRVAREGPAPALTKAARDRLFEEAEGE